jgi:hypothetical protein
MQTHTKQENTMSKTPPVEREWKLSNARHTAGVTHDGRRLWAAAVLDKQNPTAEGHLVALDPDTGAELKRYTNLRCRAGLAFDGECLWAVCGEEIKRIDPETGKVLASIPSPEPGDISGMAFAEGGSGSGPARPC